MKIYISGPISGLERVDYMANFAEAERELRAQGYDVLNPTRLAPCRHLWIYKPERTPIFEKNLLKDGFYIKQWID